MQNKIEAISDIDGIMSDICLSTPSAVSLRADILASDVQGRLNNQYGKDASNIRIMLTFKKLEDMARAHLRRNFDPDKTAEDEQLAFTEFGDDIQIRYPIKLDGGITEYQSPMYAPVDQLEKIADKEITVGETRVRRGLALLAFIKEYRKNK